jgi:hypothetical protein
VRILACAVLAHLAACYNPATLDCTVECSAVTDCAGGQQCHGGWCVGPNIECDKHGNPVQIDASMAATTDASSAPDAPGTAQQLCEQGCSRGTCDAAGVCVIDCSGEGKCTNMDVQCPAHLPCRVVCGESSCTRKVVCGMSSSCEVQCTGDGSCQDEIQCPAGDCDVTCAGASSCKRRTKCASSCSCDVSCVGALSCAEPSECPAMACKVGNGCSSIPTGCNSCN